MDPGFVNDSTIYYNLPPLVTVRDNSRRSTLPRPHSSFICERSSSCPTSPKLSIFKPKSKPPQFTDCLNRKCHEELPPKEEVSNNGVAGELPDPEPFYQNTKHPNAKPRKKAIFFPWWKRKRPESGLAEGEAGIVPEAEATEAPPKNDGPPRPPGDETLLHRDSGGSLPLPSNYLALPTRSSSCSSSTTLNEDEESTYSAERVVGGVSYVRPSKTSSPRRSEVFRRRISAPSKPITSPPAGGLDLSQRIGHWVREWGRKSRWLSRRRREKNPRNNGKIVVLIPSFPCPHSRFWKVDGPNFIISLSQVLACQSVPSPIILLQISPIIFVFRKLGLFQYQ